MSNALFFFDSILDSEELKELQHDPKVYVEINPKYSKFIQELIDIKLNGFDEDMFCIKIFFKLGNNENICGWNRLELLMVGAVVNACPLSNGNNTKLAKSSLYCSAISSYFIYIKMHQNGNQPLK